MSRQIRSNVTRRTSKFGRFLAKERLAKELPLRELAKKAKISFTTIYSLECGDIKYPTLNHFCRLANALGYAPALWLTKGGFNVLKK